MSSMRNPVGPEEPSVYWRRRAIVGVGLLVVVLVLWWLLSALFGSDEPSDQQTPPANPTPAPAASRTPAAPSPSATSTAKAASQSRSGEASSKHKTAAAKRLAPCADRDVTVVAKAASSAAEVGAGMKVVMSVTNHGTAACRRDLGAANNELRVVSGRVLVWSSNGCKGIVDGEPAKAGSVTLKPGRSWSTTVRWPGKVTSAGCPADQPTARAGTYRVIAVSGAKWSAEDRFTLT